MSAHHDHELANRLESIAFGHKLDTLAEPHVKMSRLATEPLSNYTEALL